MKAMRCYGASMRCGRPPASKRKEEPCGDAPSPTPFALEETFRQEGPGTAAGAGAGAGAGAKGAGTGGGGGAAGGGSGGVGVPMDESPGGVRLDDLLAIAQDDPPGPVLVDARWQTSW